MRWALLLLGCGCAPLLVGPGRVLPPSLQYDPGDFAVPAVNRAVEAPRRVTLPNGLEVFWTEDHSTPLVDVSLLIGCGRGDEPIGFASLTSAMLTMSFTAGAGALDGAAQRRAAAELGLEPEIKVDDGESWASFTVRTADLAASLSLLRDAVGSPRFEARRVSEELERWATGFDSPVTRHYRLTRGARARAIYGNVATLSQVATAKSMRAITDELLRTHAGMCLQPANLVLAVSGDVTRDSLAIALAPLASLQGGLIMNPLPAAPLPTARWLWLVPSPLSSKVQVELMGPGLPPGSPHRAAARVLVVALLSRLKMDLRSQMGHVYSIDGDVEVGPGSGATWLRFTTRSEVALEAVRRTLVIMQGWWDRWTFDEEVTRSISGTLRKSFARRDPAARTFEAARARLQDRPAFDPRSTDEQFDQVSSEDVRAFFVRALRPDRLQLVISGAFDPSLDWEQFGPATRIEPLR